MQKENEEEKSELITRKEAAQYLHLSAGTVANWHSSKHSQRIPCYKIGGRVFYRQTDLCKWVEQQAVNKIN